MSEATTSIRLHLGAGVAEYRSLDWQRFRDEVIRLAGFSCCSCGRGRTDEVSLQVHHRLYLPGRRPWEYALEDCVCLCSGCHAAQHGKIPPKFDWYLCGWDDLGSQSGRCDCCGMSIRYIFMIEHTQWGVWEVGADCCDNLTSTQVASGLMESVRRYAERKRRFIASPRWHEQHGVHRLSRKGTVIQIGQFEGKYFIWVNGEKGKRTFEDPLHARASVFDLIETGELQKFLQRRQSRWRQGR